MQYTDHYNLNLPEGTDIVNPLVQDNPNYTAIDTALYANKLRVIGGASEVKTGTNHAITRIDSDIDAIKFTATSNWVAGDTMTIDGVTVSVFLPNGNALADNAYIINTEVFMILNGTRATVYTSNPDTTAAIVDFVPTIDSGVTAFDTIYAAKTSVVDNLRYVYLFFTATGRTANTVTFNLPFTCANTFMDLPHNVSPNVGDVAIQGNKLYITFTSATPVDFGIRINGVVMNS